MNVDFKAKPFFLDESDIAWVQDCMKKMTVEEKVSHLFCILIKDKPVEEMAAEMDALGFYPGGYMTDVFPARKVKENFKKLQARTGIPLLFASNLERGADGICKEGTLFGTQMQIAAAGDKRWAYELGRVCGEEAAATGANWNFGPILDIDTNYHNPITNTRVFSSDQETVLQMSREFVRGQMENGMAVCLKHWPGDGRDERDQHMVTTINDCTAREWDASYGKIYKALIEDGAETVMAAHIMLPAYSRKMNPDIRDEEILPGSLSCDLTTKLLREQLGFNGLVVTDATTMTGFMQTMARRDALPLAVAAGCDMILFTLDLKEDYQYVLDAAADGTISRERLDEAVARILALKAHLKLHKKMEEGTLFPGDEALKVFEREDNRNLARECADRSVTLVKDTQNLLPISPKTQRRILLHVLGDKGGYHDPICNQAEYLAGLLEREGFEVTVYDASRKDLLPIGNSIESMTKRFDLILYYCSVKTSGSDNVSRISWTAPGGCNTPRYIYEIPTLFISVDNPYMLQDVPKVRTYIDGYTPSRYVIDAIVEKIMGRSRFTGKNPVDPFCGLFHTRL